MAADTDQVGSPGPAPVMFTVMDTSTLHVHPDDLDALRGPAAPVPSCVDDHGAWVHVPGDLDAAEARLADAGCSELLAGVLRRAAAHGCAYVRLDADGPLDEALDRSGRW